MYRNGRSKLLSKIAGITINFSQNSKENAYDGDICSNVEDPGLLLYVKYLHHNCFCDVVNCTDFVQIFAS